MITVSSLYLYPLKSARGLSLDQVVVDAFGVEGDRRFMVVGPDGHFITQRRHPKMALLSVSMAPAGLTLAFPGHGSVHVDIPTEGPHAMVEIWGESVRGHEVGVAADAWLSRCLNTPCRLVYMRDETYRPVDPDYASKPAQVSFADGFPLLLISQASLDDLNGRLGLPVDMRRFRPNIVVTGTEPFEEDGWRRVRIGSVELDVVKPCARCVMTTVDPETGQKGKEPMKTLSAYRKVDGAVLFGQNLIHRSTGNLRLGQELTVLERR